MRERKDDNGGHPAGQEETLRLLQMQIQTARKEINSTLDAMDARIAAALPVPSSERYMKRGRDQYLAELRGAARRTRGR